MLETISSEINFEKIEEKNAIKKKIVNSISYKNKVNYLDFIRDLSNYTKTPISFIIDIFNGLNKNFKNEMISNNPKQALQEIKLIINNNLINEIIGEIKYDGMNASVSPNVFKTENNETFLKAGSTGKFQKEINEDFSLKDKWIFKEIIEYDSDFELQIIEKDQDNKEIEIFGKLPKLEIKTPIGNYNPDFCYVIKKDNQQKVFLIVEAKGYENKGEIPENEKNKINFAKKYFEALNDYFLQNKENVKISFQKRINKTKLSELIKNNT